MYFELDEKKIAKYDYKGGPELKYIINRQKSLSYSMIIYYVM